MSASLWIRRSGGQHFIVRFTSKMDAVEFAFNKIDFTCLDENHGKFQFFASMQDSLKSDVKSIFLGANYYYQMILFDGIEVPSDPPLQIMGKEQEKEIHILLQTSKVQDMINSNLFSPTEIALAETAEENLYTVEAILV